MGQQLKTTKNPPLVYQLLGQLYLQEKEYSAAIKHLEKAVEINPNLLSAYYLIGNAHTAQKNFDKAIDDYQKVLRANPQAFRVHMLLGVIYDLKQEPAKAIEHYQKVLDINKNFAPAANNLAWHLSERGGNLDVALRWAQKARELEPDAPHIADTLGWIYYKKGIYATAVSLLKESSEKFQNNNPTVLYHLGMASYRSGDQSLARRALNQALKLDGSSPWAEEARKVLAELGTSGQPAAGSRQSR